MLIAHIPSLGRTPFGKPERKTKMKQLKLIMTIIALSISLAQAHLVDLTPGGFNPDQGLPPAYYLLQQQTFFDEAAHGWFDLPGGRQYLNQWVSLYGALNGGTYFFTNIFTLPAETPSALIWWDFTGQPDGYYLTMVLVEGRKADGTAWANIYAVRGRGPQIRRLEEQLVTLDGMASIYGISFFGRN
jgi:hypothetical protein